MPTDEISVINVDVPWVREVLTSVTVEVIIKWGLVAGLVMYSLFALVIVKQVGIMAETF